MKLTVNIPTAHHSGNSLRNLVNLIYTRAGLINRALGTGFSVEQGLVEALSSTTLPKTTEPDHLKVFTELVAMMNRQALEQKHIQAKEFNDENEKYALRVWLTCLGMNGSKYKTTRKILMGNLSGHSAFQIEAEKDIWEESQPAKRGDVTEG